MNNFEIINQILINSMLDILKIQYISCANCLCLFENWRVTDWWIGNVSENYINDFSWKWRPSWPPFAFVKKYLKLSDKETFDWFEENFGIWWEATDKTKKIYKKREILKLPAYSIDR